MVSANRATDPEIATTATCASDVAPSATRLILTVQMPFALDSNASSMESAAS
jgi:hypothetical protein